MKTATHVTGFLNFLGFLLSIPVLGGAIWLSSRAATTDCFKFLQWPLVVVGVSLILVSLAGFAGTCYRNTFLMYVYLWAMFFIIATLVGLTVFAFSVAGRGSVGHPVLNRVYLEYDLRDFSGWLAGKVAGKRNWEEISSCVRDSDVCRQMAVAGDTAEMFYLRKLTPIQSGCCKPPTSCGYTYINETYWVSGGDGGGLTGGDKDCATWSDDQEELCYSCDSCKAGVLATAASSWRRVSVINVVILIVLVLLYVVAYKAFRHNKKLDNDEAYGETRMEKAQPR